MAFHTEESPLLEEWLRLAESVAAAPTAPLGPEDALVVIDMQADFVPKSALNAQGGRFGVAEGDHVVPLIERLIDSATAAGATICATRDYHPHDHCSFNTCGGPFPPHCLQGSEGSYFHPRIGAKLSEAMRRVGPEKVMVAFKAFHEQIDSFGAFPYLDGGDGRLAKNGCNAHALGVFMGCAKAPFTGSLVLKQSALTGEAVNINAPPDVLSVLDDGVDRKMRTIHEVLKDKKRIFVCGLAMDFCVLDSCLNARAAGLAEVHMVLDAARAAHIPGVGSFGSGFLSQPSEVAAKMKAAGVKVVDSASLAGVSPGQLKASLPQKQGFPAALAPLSLANSRVESKMLEGNRFQIQRSGPLASVSLPVYEGKCSPCAKLPGFWPGAPAGATELCFAEPVVSSASADLQKTFLSISASPELCFAAYGGFLLLDAQRQVLAVQAVGLEEAALQFGEPRVWREAFTAVLKDAGRFRPVTLPSLLRQGALEFAWVNPKEDLTAGPEVWRPSDTGAFVYLMAHGPAVYFPVKAEAKRSSELATLIKDLTGKVDATDEQKVSTLLGKLGCQATEVDSLLKTFQQDVSGSFSIEAFLAWMWNE